MQSAERTNSNTITVRLPLSSIKAAKSKKKSHAPPKTPKTHSIIKERTSVSAKFISKRIDWSRSEFRVLMAREGRALTLTPSERNELIRHVVRLMSDEAEKKELIAVLVRLLSEEDNGLKFLTELEKDSPMFFNPMLFEDYVTNRQWMKAEEYLLKFFCPDDKILSFCENLFCSGYGHISGMVDEIEAARDRILDELKLSQDVLASILHIPLRCLVDSVKSQCQGRNRTYDVGPSLSTERPCGACTVTRDRCDHLCEFYPYFPRRDAENFIAVREVFGKKKVIDLLKVVPQESKASTISNLISEAKIRRRDPVGGCMAVIASLQAKLDAERDRSISGHQVERHFLEPTGDKGTTQFWRAMAGEQDVMQEAYKVEEAKAAADRAMDLATRKRERAQMLLQNSELATYKAVMAVHIAEAAEAVGSTEDVADLLLDRD